MGACGCAFPPCLPSLSHSIPLSTPELTHLLGNSLDSQPTCCGGCCGGGACAMGHLAASTSKAPLLPVAGRWVPAIAVMLMTLPPPLLDGMRLPSAAPRRVPLFARRA